MQYIKENPDIDSISVEIYHGKITVSKEDRDPLYISSLAKFVNEKINEITSKTKIVDTTKVGILAALDISDELFKLKENTSNNTEQIDSQIQEMITLISNTIAD